MLSFWWPIWRVLVLGHSLFLLQATVISLWHAWIRMSLLYLSVLNLWTSLGVPIPHSGNPFHLTQITQKSYKHITIILSQFMAFPSHTNLHTQLTQTQTNKHSHKNKHWHKYKHNQTQAQWNTNKHKHRLKCKHKHI